jgi:hypothetical protein
MLWSCGSCGNLNSILPTLWSYSQEGNIVNMSKDSQWRALINMERKHSVTTKVCLALATVLLQMTIHCSQVPWSGSVLSNHGQLPDAWLHGSAGKLTSWNQTAAHCCMHAAPAATDVELAFFNKSSSLCWFGTPACSQRKRRRYPCHSWIALK